MRADRAGLLRLFDLAGDGDELPSHVGRADAPVSDRDTHVPIRDAAAARVRSTKEALRADGSVLTRAAEAAARTSAAETALDEAIAAARAAGCSWRSIGAATGRPYQTLHRRTLRRDGR